MRFGRAEGGLADINQLDNLMRGLGFTQKKADDQVRFAVLNTVTLLRTHAGAHDALADAMMAGKGVAACIRAIEERVDASTLRREEGPVEVELIDREGGE